MSTSTQRLKETVYRIYHNPLTPAPVKEVILDACDLADFMPDENIDTITYAEGVQVLVNGD